MVEETLHRLIRDVPDFPKAGIIFKDITPVLEDGAAFREVVDALADRWRGRGITRIVGVEARGFIFGAALAYALGLGFVIVRKPGKLPRATASITYALEYGTDRLEMHADALGPEDRALIVDDVLATGGTAAAVAQMIRDRGATLGGLAFVLELHFLGGRAHLPPGAEVHTLHVVR